MTEDIIADQIAYYRARAPRYDDWWAKRENWDFGDEVNRAFQADVAESERWVRSLALSGDVLELASGTGIWTGMLAETADRVLAVDASPEMHAINAGKNSAPSIERVVADVFSWEPPRRFDHVFFGFWLSHVPDDGFEPFWSMLERALAPEGSVAFIDNAHPDVSRRCGPDFDDRAIQSATGVRTDYEAHTSTRELPDGSSWTIVKRFWHADDLQAALEGLGWAAEVGTTEWAFLRGVASRS